MEKNIGIVIHVIMMEKYKGYKNNRKIKIMNINKDESCYGCKHGYWVSDHHGTSYYCSFKKKYNVGERHIQGKIDITYCWKKYIVNEILVKMYIRGPDTLNPLRLLQATALYNNKITIDQYIELVQMNYGHNKINKDNIERNAITVWEISLKRFEEMGILIKGNSNIIHVNLYKIDKNENK